jgi:hypothetical protein
MNMMILAKSAVKSKRKVKRIRPAAGVWNYEQTARNRAANAHKIGTELEPVAVDAYQEAKAILSRVLNADPKANGVLHNLEDNKGREYKCAIGFEFVYWRLSDSYQQKQAKRHRRTIYEAFMNRIDDIKAYGLQGCFFTPTYPNFVGVRFEKNSDFHARGWELFLRESGEFFLGGYSRIEFTERSKTDEISINYHNHALTILAKEIAFGNSFDLENRKKAGGLEPAEKRAIANSLRIAKIWTRCLKKAHREIFGKPMKIKTVSGNCRVDFKEADLSEIENYDADTKSGVLFELAGYTAKQANFVGLLKNTEHGAALLAEAEYVFRGKRILTGFGIFQAKRKAKRTAKPATVNQESGAATPLLSRQHTVEKSSAKSKLSPINPMPYQTRKSLLKCGIELIEAGRKDEWLSHLEKVKNLLILERRNRLLSHFPNAIFTDLSGNTFYGENVRNFLDGH